MDYHQQLSVQLPLRPAKSSKLVLHPKSGDIRQGRPGAGEVVHKGVMGRLEQAQDPAPSKGAAARKMGARNPSPSRTRTGAGAS